MAKKSEMNLGDINKRSSVMASTEPEAEASSSKRDKDDKVKTIGSALRTSEINALLEWTEAHGTTLSSLITALIRRSAKDLLAGKLPLEIKRTRIQSEEFTDENGNVKL